MNTVTGMPASTSAGSTERHSEPEAGPRGFTAVNITPPQSRGTHQKRRSLTGVTNDSPDSSPKSPDNSPKHSVSGANGHQYKPSLTAAGHKRSRSSFSNHSPEDGQYDRAPPQRSESQQQHMEDRAGRALRVLETTNQQPNGYYPALSTDNAQYSYGRPPGSPPRNGQHMHEGVVSGEGRIVREYTDSGDGGRYEEGSDNPATLPAGQRRKRNFANRTKTGCLTCRDRKKKCDEAHPICQNCARGGFTCKGYQARGGPAWARPNSQKQPITPQPKETDEQTTYEQNLTPISAGPASVDSKTVQQRPSMTVAADGHPQSRPPHVPEVAQPAMARPPYPSQQQHQQTQWGQYNTQPMPPSAVTPHPSIPFQQQPPSRHSSYGQDNQPLPVDGQRTEQLLSHHNNDLSSAGPQHQSPPQQQRQDNPSQHPSQPQDMSRPPPQASSVSSHLGPQPPNWPQQRPPPHQVGPPMSGPPQPQGPQPPPAPPSHVSPPPQTYAHGPPSVSNQQQQHPDYQSRPRPYPPLIDTNQPQPVQANQRHTANTANTANIANTATPSYTPYEQKPIHRVFTNEDVERSRMLRGAPYNYFDKTLHNERQRCATALQRYSNACQLGSGVSEPELQNILLKVFVPKKDQTHSFLAANPLEGTLGPGVRIEPGFRCTYGYNLRVMDNVFIGENTRIDDAGRVDIGSRTWIGANVTILTNDVSRDMTNRKGTDGQLCFTNQVVIGSEVVIGPGAVIYPGCRLGKGCTVEPFAIVRGNLGEYEVQKAYEGHRHSLAGPPPGPYGMVAPHP